MPASGPRSAIDKYLTGANHAFWRRDIAVDVFFDPDADPVDTAARGGRLPRPRGTRLHLRRGRAVVGPRDRLRRSQALPALRLRQDPDGGRRLSKKSEVMPVLTVDDIKVEVPEGTTVLDACRQAGAKVPTLCYLEGVQAIGACRLCLVEMEGASTLVASCAQPATEGMVVQDQPTARAARARSGPRTAPLRARRRLPDLRAQRRLRAAQAWPATCSIDEVTYEGEKTTARSSTTSTPALVRDTGKCVSVPALRDRLQRDPGRGRPVRPGPRLHHRHRPGLRQQPQRRGLRAVRPVRRRVPGGRHHREQRRSSRCGRPWTTPPST